MSFLKVLFFKKRLCHCAVLSGTDISATPKQYGWGYNFLKKKKALLRYDVLTIVYKSVTFNTFIELCNISIVQF